jgi:hypothetical protein
MTENDSLTGTLSKFRFNKLMAARQLRFLNKGTNFRQTSEYVENGILSQ